MKITIPIILITIVAGCGPTSKVNSVNPVAENYKDVFILSALVRDHLIKTNGRTFNLDLLVQQDSLRRITDNFEKIELKPKGGYIAVYYTFSNSRNINKLELSEKESETMNRLKWVGKKLNEQYDGEIQLDYGERFYKINKIVVKKESTGAGRS
jgi:hypothetical protein